MSLDDALEWAGDNSSYQQKVSSIFSIQYGISSFLMMGLPLLIVYPTFECLQPDGTYAVCKESEACSSGNFRVNEALSDPSITLTFELYCDKSYIRGWLGSLLFIGAFLAGFVIPYIANWRGRKTAIFVSIALSVISLITMAVSPYIELLIIFLIITGLAFSGFEIMSFVYTAEASGERFRNIASATMAISWSFAQILIAPLFFIFGSNWRVICIALMAVPLLVSLWPTYTFVQETPRFLNSKRRYQEARDVINKICKVNKKPRFQAKFTDEAEDEQNGETTFFRKRQKTGMVIETSEVLGYIDLFKNPQLRKITIALLYIWFFRNFTYYGLNYALPALGTHVYFSFSFGALAETAANFLAGRLSLSMGRILSLTISVTVVTICCLLIIFFPIPEECYLAVEGCYQRTLSIIFAILAKFCIAFFANILVTYTSESYPTEVRSLGLGLTLSTGRLGGVAMSFIITAVGNTQVNPLFVFGVFGLVALLIICFCLPETYGTILKDFMTQIKPKKEIPLLRISEKSDHLEQSFSK